jgi:hypothetical protein
MEISVLLSQVAALQSALTALVRIPVIVGSWPLYVMWWK